MTKKTKKSLFSGSRWQLYVLLAPFLTFFTLMIVLPVLSSMVLSFFNFLSVVFLCLTVV